MTETMKSFPGGGMALVVGASGGIGSALVSVLEADPAFARVVGLSRSSRPALDITDEGDVAHAAEHVARLVEEGTPLRLVMDATGLLSDAEMQPEKALRQIDPAAMARSFAVNSIGPALLLKHLSPLMPRDGKAVFATLSAKVGSIGDNVLGGWVSYRASKAALNQILRTASIEIARRRPEQVLLALHPGTVDTGLSRPFSRTGLDVQSAEVAARRLLSVVDAAGPDDTGAFLSHRGERLPW
jgi:NAD(P)-dependent dehydrogenase (short-subunit alcohol dehydrogenase family)